MKKVILVLLAAVMAASVLGCGAGDGTGGDDGKVTPETIAGTYAFTKLTQGNGVTLVPPDIGGTVTLTSSETYSMSLTVKAAAITESGAFELEGTIIHWKWAERSEWAGTISGDHRTLTQVTNGGERREFTKL